MDKSIITVKIFGHEYTIKGVAEPDYIIKLGNYLDSKMREIYEATGLKDEKKIAILAGINIADELFELKKKLKENYTSNEQIQLIRNKIEDLITLIDKELPSELNIVDNNAINLKDISADNIENNSSNEPSNDENEK